MTSFEMYSVTNFGKIGDTNAVSILYPNQKLGRLSTTSLDALIEEADKLIENHNYIQACEKYYKVMEEAIKKLVEVYKDSVEEIKEIVERIESLGFWYTKLLEQAAQKISEILKKSGLDNEASFYSAWEDALRLHRDCFHEQILDSEKIREKKDKIIFVYSKIKELLTKIDEQYLTHYDQGGTYFITKPGS